MVSLADVIGVIKELNITQEADVLKPDVPLSEQGIDSLDRSSLYFELEDRFKKKLKEDDEAQYRTLNGMVQYINAK